MTIYEVIVALLPAAGYGRRQHAPYGLLEVEGPDAVDFLQRLCSQDVAGLEVGQCAPAAFLDPKGKLIATATVARAESERLFVETQRPVLDQLAALLERYHFTERLTIHRRDGLAAVELLGAAPHPGTIAAGACRADDDGVELAGARHGVRWARRHGVPAAVASWRADVAPLDEELAECLRIVAGIVRVGVDTEPGTLALEADLDDHVSTSKGCYTGQEIVARIHTYGHVNRRLALLRVETAAPIERATTVCDVDGDPVGRVMSAVRIPGREESLGLGYLPEAFVDDPDSLVLGDASGPAVHVEAFAPA